MARGGWQPKQPAASSAREYEGTIKSMDAEQGLGLISCPELSARYDSDVVFPAAELQHFVVGDLVRFALSFDTAQRPHASALRQPQESDSARNLCPSWKTVSPDDGAAAAAACVSETARSNQERSPEQFYQGVVKGVNEEKGFGFIRCAFFPRDVYFQARHADGVRASDHVEFVVKHNGRGQIQAMQVRAQVNDEASQGSSKSRSRETCQAVPTHSGIVKARLEDKGYGFIKVKPAAHEAKQPDVFVHLSQLKELYPGDKVWFSVKTGSKGLQAVLVTSRDASDDESEDEPSSASRVPSHRGILKHIDKEHGYAFIRCKSARQTFGGDVFVHQKQMKAFTLGDPVSFVLKINKRGRPSAVYVNICEPFSESDNDDTDIEDDLPARVGNIKCFDPDKGYGFIACGEVSEEFGRDAFLHQRQMRDFKVGDAVAFVVKLNAAGHPQACALKEAPKTMSWLMPEDAAKETFIGRIKSFNALKGFGYIACHAVFDRFEKDVFIPLSQFKNLKVGDAVEFTIGVKNGHPQAHDVRKAEGDIPEELLASACQTKDADDETEESTKDLFTGEIKSFNTVRGFGYIECRETFHRWQKDVFIPSSQYVDVGVGDVVEFNVVVKNGHPQAHDVQRVQDDEEKPPVNEFFGLELDLLSRKLHRASASAVLDSLQTMQKLLEARADPNFVSATKEVPLMVAALNVRRSEHKCRLLLGHRADVHASVGSQDLTVLQWTKQRIDQNFAAFLQAVSQGEAADLAISLDDGGRDADF